jgi:ribosomal protein S18 acetylase RimI-like enzyme
VNEDLSGAVLWLDVDVNAGEDPGAAEFRQIFVDALGQQYAERFFMLDDLFSAGHPGHESHAYLMFAGVMPHRQGQGVGSALITHRLADLDASRTPAYLEASCVRNAHLYARLGFEATGSPVVLPDGPTLYPMWRPGMTSPNATNG